MKTVTVRCPGGHIREFEFIEDSGYSYRLKFKPFPNTHGKSRQWAQIWFRKDTGKSNGDYFIEADELDRLK